MWAHLASDRSSSTKIVRTTLIAGVVASLLVALEPKAMAADVTAPFLMAPGSSGKTGDATIAPEGDLKTGFAFSGAEQVMNKSDITSTATEEDATALQDAHRGSLFLGVALTKNFEFTLGVHGTFEHVKPEVRDTYFAGGETERELFDDSWRQNVKQTGFAGASLMFKLGLVKESGFSLALAPFVESGAGEQATYSLTRSVSPKVGWMVMSTYEYERTAKLSLNGGYRYRDAEEIGALVLRNELFYQGALSVNVMPELAVFVGGQGRKIMVNRDGERDASSNAEEGKRIYKARETGEWNAGLSVKIADADLSAFYGRGFESSRGFGMGQSSFGLAVAMPIGNYEGRRGTPKFASEVEKEMERDARLKSKDAPAAPAPLTDEQQYPEMIGSEIDPLEALGKEDDDFEATRRAVADQEKVTGPSEDEKIAEELRVLQEAEDKALAEAEAEEKAALAKSRTERAKQAREDDERLKEWMREADEELEGVQGISDDEMNWNGLED